MIFSFPYSTPILAQKAPANPYHLLDLVWRNSVLHRSSNVMVMVDVTSTPLPTLTGWQESRNMRCSRNQYQKPRVQMLPIKSAGNKKDCIIKFFHLMSLLIDGFLIDVPFVCANAIRDHLLLVHLVGHPHLVDKLEVVTL